MTVHTFPEGTTSHHRVKDEAARRMRRGRRDDERGWQTDKEMQEEVLEEDKQYPERCRW